MAAAQEARALRPVGQRRSNGLPLAQQGPEDPSPDAPAKGTHGHAHRRRVLDNLQLEADGRRILVKGKTTKELVLVEETPDKETYREKLRTTVVALDLGDGVITDIAA